MSFDDANPFKKLDVSQFRNGDSKAKKVTGTSPSPQSVPATASEPEEGENVFYRAMSGVAPLNGKKAAKGHGTKASAKRLAAKKQSGMQALAETDSFRRAMGASDPVIPDKDRTPEMPPVEKGDVSAHRTKGGAVSPATPQNTPRGASTMEDVFTGHDQDEDNETFLQAMQGVSGIVAKGRDVRPQPVLSARPKAVKAAQALQDLLDGNVEFQLEYSEEYIQGYVAGFDPAVMGRMRNGQYSPEGHLDLHGMVAQEAYDALVSFMRGAYNKGLRMVLLIPGRGRNSPEGYAILREKLQQWLTHDPFRRVVLAFCTAQPRDGGAGAVYVMLRKFKKSRGKVHWDRTPSDPDLYV